MRTGSHTKSRRLLQLCGKFRRRLLQRHRGGDVVGLLGTLVLVNKWVWVRTRLNEAIITKTPQRLCDVRVTERREGIDDRVSGSRACGAADRGFIDYGIVFVTNLARKVTFPTSTTRCDMIGVLRWNETLRLNCNIPTFAIKPLPRASRVWAYVSK